MLREDFLPTRADHFLQVLGGDLGWSLCHLHQLHPPRRLTDGEAGVSPDLPGYTRNTCHKLLKLYHEIKDLRSPSDPSIGVIARKLKTKPRARLPISKKKTLEEKRSEMIRWN